MRRRRRVTARNCACTAQRQRLSADATSEYHKTRCKTSIGLPIAPTGNVKQEPICADVKWRRIRRDRRLRRRRALGIRQSQRVYSEEQSSRLRTGQRGTPTGFNHSCVGLFDRACNALLL